MTFQVASAHSQPGLCGWQKKRNVPTRTTLPEQRRETDPESHSLVGRLGREDGRRGGGPWAQWLMGEDGLGMWAPRVPGRRASLPPLNRDSNGGSERVSHLPKVTQVITGELNLESACSITTRLGHGPCGKAWTTIVPTMLPW